MISKKSNNFLPKLLLLRKFLRLRAIIIIILEYLTEHPDNLYGRPVF
jgi:hypothetical protein